jgi:hypothetical protein
MALARACWVGFVITPKQRLQERIRRMVIAGPSEYNDEKRDD